MPKIDVRGVPGKDAGSTLDPNSLAANRIPMDGKESAAAEMRLRKMVREYDSYLLSEAQKTEQSLSQTAERGAAARVSADKRRLGETAQAKVQKDREYQGLWKGLLGERDRAEKAHQTAQMKAQREAAAASVRAGREKMAADKTAASEALKTQRTAEREKAKLSKETEREQIKAQRDQARAAKEQEREQAKVVREQARAQQQSERAEQQAARRRTHHRKEQVKAFGFGAVLGGAVGGVASGDLGGVLGAVGGGLGGGAGFALGSAFGPVGAMVGKAIGSAIGSLAGIAVNPYSGAYRASKPYLDFQEGAYDIGRLRGQSGDSVDRTLFDHGHRVPPQWMQDIGMGGISSSKALLDLGYAQKGGLQPTLTTIGTLANKTDAFAGLGMGAVTGMLGRGGAYGINSPEQTGTGRMQGVVDVLAEANARGLDKSRILDSINASLDNLVSLSGNRDIEGITKLTSQLMETGTAGGMTGATARGIIAGNASVGENILGNNIVSTAMTALLPKYGMLKTKEDVARMAGVPVDSIPESAMNDILSAAKNGRMNGALRMLASPAVVGQGRLNSLLTEAQPLLGIPGDLSSIYGTAAGGSLSENQGYKESLQYGGMSALDKGIMRYNGNNPGYAASVEGIYKKNFGSAATAGWNPKIGRSGYMKALTARGVPQDIAAMVISESEKRGLNPALAASVMMQENSQFNSNAVHRDSPGKDGKERYSIGLFQTENTNPYFSLAQTGKAGQVAAGVGYLSDTIKSRGGFGDQGGSNVATVALRDKSINEQGDLNEAFLSLKTLEPAARMFTNAVDKFQKAVEELVHGANPAKVGQVIHGPSKTPFARAYNQAMEGAMVSP